jgi:hypothetical protein
MIFFDVRESETLEQEQETEVEQPVRMHHAIYIYDVVELKETVIQT